MVLARALYSSSVLECDTVGYFRELHDAKLGPKNIAKPLVEHRSFGQLAQPASKKALNNVEEDLRIYNPIVDVSLMYMSILLTTLH